MSETTLTPTQKRRLKHVEEEMRDGILKFANGLRIIHSERLYLEEFPTFEKYLAARFNKSRTWAYRLIDFTEVVSSLEAESVLPIGNIENGQKPKKQEVSVPPATESQARPLVAVPPEQRAEVWQTAQAEAGTEQPPASKVKEVAERVVQEPKAESNGKAEPVKPKRGALKDADGTVVPDNLIDAFTRAGELSALMKKPFAAILEHLYDHHDWLYGGERDNRKLPKGRFTIGTIQPHFDQIASLVSGVTPRVVCNKCDGGGCQVCKARGWLP